MHHDDESIWGGLTPRSPAEWLMMAALVVGFVLLSIFGGTCSVSIRSTPSTTTTVAP